MDRAQRAEALVGRTLRDAHGEDVGVVEEVVYSRRTGEPGFAVVRGVAVPLDGAALDADGSIVVRHPRERIDTAPTLPAQLDGAAVERVRAHFAAGDRAGDATTAELPPSRRDTGPGEGAEAAAQAATAAREDDAADLELHEEQLVVDTRRTATERVFLRKEVVTEEVTISVTVRREELVIERQPIDDAAEAADRGDGDRQLEEGELEFVLYAEEPVVTTRVVPVDRVRVRREAVPEEHLVTRELRREQVDVERQAPQNGT